jgi:heme oxygenase
MSLKELTLEKHRQAEETPFMKALFNGVLPLSVWADFLYQKWNFYSVIEQRAREFNLIDDMPEVCREKQLYDDYVAINIADKNPWVSDITQEYCEYLYSLNSADQVLAHFYTWHMGDMYGGQMINKILNTSNSHLYFDNRAELINKLRAKLDDNMANEANVAFDWAIRILNSYDI